MTHAYKHAPLSIKRQPSIAEESRPFLPEDMIREILSRSSVKTLMRLICLSKFFHKLITCDRRFAYSHLSRSPRHVDVMAFSDVVFFKGVKDEDMYDNLIVSLKKKSFSNPLYLGQNNTQLVGSCNGIICFLLEWFDSSRVYLWNPSLHQIRDLPGIEIQESEDDFFGFGYDSKNQQHKIVRIHYGLSSKVELFSLEKDSWKSFNHDVPPDEYRACLEYHVKPLEFNGSLHWISHNFCVLKFGLSDDKVREFPLPRCDDMCIKKVSLGVVKGCLSVLSLKCGRGHEVWSMMDAKRNGDCSWTKTFVFIDALYENIEYGDEMTPSGKISTQGGLYDPETNIWREQYFENNDYYSLKVPCKCYFIDYVYSLISVHPPVTGG